MLPELGVPLRQVFVCALAAHIEHLAEKVRIRKRTDEWIPQMAAAARVTSRHA